MLAAYRASLQGDRQQLLDSFRFRQIARKVVGVGSVGTRAWVILMTGSDDGDPLFLQAKEAEASVLEPYAGASRFANHGQRVVEGQRLMQAASDIFLGWCSVVGIDGRERDFYVRQLWDWKRSADVERLSPAGLEAYARMCGRTLARAHARSGDRVAIAAYLGARLLLRPGDRRVLRGLRRAEPARPRGAAGGDRVGPARGAGRLGRRRRRLGAAPAAPLGSAPPSGRGGSARVKKSEASASRAAQRKAVFSAFSCASS